MLLMSVSPTVCPVAHVHETRHHNKLGKSCAILSGRRTFTAVDIDTTLTCYSPSESLCFGKALGGSGGQADGFPCAEPSP